MAIRKYVPVAFVLVALLAGLTATPAAAAKPQTITFESTAPSPGFIGGSYVVKASASSGLPVNLASATPSVCSLSGSSSGATASFKAEGTCTIDANQPGNAEWEAAKQENQTFQVVQKKPQTITFKSTPPKPGFVSGTYNVEATASSGLAVSFTSATEAVCTVAESTVTFHAAGTCKIDANQAGNVEWQPAPQGEQSVEVSNKRAQSVSITSTPANPTFGGEYAVAASATSGLPVTISTSTPETCTASGTTVTFAAVGTCTVQATQAGNGEYEEAKFSQTFAVGKAKQAIAFTSSAPASATIGGTPYTVTASASSGLPVSFASGTPSVCTVSGSTVSFVGAGTCTIDANQAGDADHEPAKTETQSFAVHQLPQTVAFTSTPPNPAQVGGTYVVSAESSVQGFVVSFFVPTTSVCTISGSTVTFIAAGICTIDAEQPGNGEYAPAPQVQQSFIVSPAPAPPGPPAPGPIVHVKPVVIPNSSFRVVGASLSLTTYAITFVESVSDPGTFTWVLTFQNGKFGVFAAAKTCQAGSVRIKGKCRPARVLFARGSQTVTATGSVTFTVKPTRAGVQALRKAFKLHRGLPVTADVTFQSARGGQPAVRVQSLIIKGRR